LLKDKVTLFSGHLAWVNRVDQQLPDLRRTIRGIPEWKAIDAQPPFVEMFELLQNGYIIDTGHPANWL